MQSFQGINPLFGLSLLVGVFALANLAQAVNHLHWLDRRRAVRSLALGAALCVCCGGLVWRASLTPMTTVARVNNFGPDWDCGTRAQGSICIRHVQAAPQQPTTPVR